VAARLLAGAGLGVDVFLLGRRRELKGDALASAKELEKCGIRIGEIVSRAGLDKFRKAAGSSDLVVDALFGTGFRGPAGKLCAGAIGIVNRSPAPVLAVDIPSGVDGQTGRAEGPAVKADATVTMGLLKTGLLFHPGKELSGRVVTADIGFPPAALKDQNIRTFLADPGSLRGWLPGRRPDAHKGDCGRVVVLAGSAGMAGAACLAAETALRSGAGLVQLGVPESLNDVIQSKLAEVITRPLPETRGRTLSLSALGSILRLAEKADVLLIGPGLSRHPETAELVRELVGSVKLPAVLDADGLNAFASAQDLVLTPHYGELSRLLKSQIPQIRADPLGQAREAAQRFDNVVVLKGAPSVTGLPDGRAWINPTGNAGMATAGSGDVLSGLIAGLMAQGAAPERAAVLGVFLHGLAGDLAREEMTEYCLLAGDIIRHLPVAYKSLMEEF
jgi:NAD(P)H-hydrate epimerase